MPAKRAAAGASRDPGTRVRAVALDPRLKAEGNDKRWWRRWCDRCNRCAHTLGPAMGESTSLHAVPDAAPIATPQGEVAPERPARAVGPARKSAVEGKRGSVRIDVGTRAIVKTTT